MQVDYTTGIMLIVRVDRALDKPVLSLRPRNKVERDAHKCCDGSDMYGLPVGV